VWKRRRRELDDELATLQHTRRLRERLHAIDRPTAQRREHTRLTDQQLAEVLGPRPTDAWRARLWAALAEQIHTYRSTWQVTDRHSVLGHDPDDPAHQRARADLAETLRAAAKALGTPQRDGPNPTHTQPERERGQERGVAPGR
jgi:hypothetical protein